MQAKRLSPHGTIGLICASHVADAEKYAVGVKALERLGFRVKLGANFYKDTYGYAASAAERAEDFNALVADEEVGMVLFGGGESAVEMLPLIDYENIRRHPKLFSSYSDGTSLLNAIHAQTGLVTYYGVGAAVFFDLRQYDYAQFCAHFVEGYAAEFFASDSPWQTIRGGACAGTLIGGYAPLFGLMLSNLRFQYRSDRKYLLFLEDHESFCEAGAIATWLAFIGQSAFMRNVAGLIFGHYSLHVPEPLLHCLARFGDAHGIPVVYTDDFGHGTRHAILPIGIDAELDADQKRLRFRGIR